MLCASISTIGINTFWKESKPLLTDVEYYIKLFLRARSIIHVGKLLTSTGKKNIAMRSMAPLVATANGGHCYVHDKTIDSCCLCKHHCVEVTN